MHLIVCSFFCLHMNAWISWCEVIVMEGGVEFKGQSSSLCFLTCPVLVLLGLVWDARKRGFVFALLLFHISCHQAYLAYQKLGCSCNCDEADLDRDRELGWRRENAEPLIVQTSLHWAQQFNNSWPEYEVITWWGVDVEFPGFVYTARPVNSLVQINPIVNIQI